MRVERLFDAAHDGDGAGAGFFGQVVHFVDADAVFAGAGAVHGDGAGDEGLAEGFGALAFGAVVGVDEVAEVEVAVADVADEEVGDAAGLHFLQ